MQIYLARNGQQAGPYTLEQLNQMLTSQQVLLTDLIWHEGMSEWKILGEITHGQLKYTPAGFSEPSQTPTYVHIQSNVNDTLPSKELELASLSSRAIAKAIDMFFWFIAAFIPTFFLSPSSIKEIEKLQSGAFSNPKLQEQFYNLIPTEAWYITLIYIVIMLAIQAFLLAKRGQSIGKIITKIKIVDEKTCLQVDLTRVFLIRSVVFIILVWLMSPITAMIESAFAFGQKKQALHDRLAKTKVIKAK